MTAISYHDRKIEYTLIRQKLPSKKITNLRERVHQEMELLSFGISSGDKIAIGVGSRGIINIRLMVSEIVKFIRETGGDPFIFPAMGSHGGATAEGQANILRHLEIDEEHINAPVRSSMEVINLSEDPAWPVYMDEKAYSADGIILVNRIAPHTDFSGEFESGLVKMAAIGMGKVPQAEFIHGKGVEGLEKYMPEIARRVLASGKLIGGVGIIEDANKDTMEVKAIPASQIMDREKELLKLARQNCPRLPLDHIDVLIVDQIGKDISGVGMDPYVIGRMRLPDTPDPDYPNIRSIIACSLTEGSHGNGLGIGLADVITRRLFDQLDMSMIYRNVYTSTFLERAKVPVIGENERQCLEFALRNCGEVIAGKEVILRIKNTLHLGKMYVSGPALKKMKENMDIEIISTPVDMISEDGRMTEWEEGLTRLS